MTAPREPRDELREAAHRLAMLVLQSKAYNDPDTRDAVDDVLLLTTPRLQTLRARLAHPEQEAE